MLNPVPGRPVQMSPSAAVLDRALDRHTTASLADRVRIMNGYYSNLIGTPPAPS